MNIAIKTHQRPEQLKAFTFAVLQRHGFTLSDVNLFVSGESQLSLYRAKLPSFAGRITMVKEPGVSAAVNAIARFYPEGEPVLHLDDDIEQIQRLESGKLVNCSDFKQTVREGFGLCQSLKCNLWGVYPVRNAFFMSHGMSTGLRFIWAGCYGFISGGENAPLIECKMKDDFERSIKSFLKCGAVLRFNDIVCKTKFIGKKGGTASDAACNEKHVADAHFLKARYPSLVRLHAKRGFGGLDVLLVNPREAKVRSEKILTRV